MPLVGTSPSHRVWLSTDCCGLVCATMTWTLHIFCWSTTTRLVILPWLGPTSAGYGHLCAYSCLFGLALWSHAAAMLCDPGAVPPEAEPLPDEKAAWAAKDGGWQQRRMCHKCNSFKPARAHHDSVTGRCIVKLDHFW